MKVLKKKEGLNISKKEVLFNINHKITDKNKYVIGVKKNNETFKYKINKILDDDIYVLAPVNDFKSEAVCPKSCAGELLDLTLQEEMEIYYQFRPLPLTKNQQYYKKMLGVGKVRFELQADRLVWMGKPARWFTHMAG